MNAKKTPLYQSHVDLNGKIVEFGGWLLPVQYTSIIEEHNAVREKAGIFDVSHMGEVSVKGKDALRFVQKILTNDISTCKIGQIKYSPMCYQNGGVVDDLLVYMLGENDYMLVINAANIDKDWAWMMEQRNGFELELKNISEEIAEIALQGPLAETILTQMTKTDLSSLDYYYFIPDVTILGKPTLVSRTGYTGEDGFEIYCHPQYASELWEAILNIGEPLGLKPAGLGCRDTLRFEACMPLYGHELSPDITPIEAGIGRFVSIDKEEYIGKEILVEQKVNGVTRKVVGFEMLGRGIARSQYDIYRDDKKIGVVTTGSYSPTLNKNIGMALVDKKYALIGQKIDILIRGKQVEAQVIAKPFYKRTKGE